MITMFRMMCQVEYRKHISLPKENWFTQTEDSIVFTYFIYGRMRFITLSGREAVADFLLENGMIESYEGSGNTLRMYEKKLLTVTGKNYEPVQWIRTSLLEWNRIKFFQSDVIHFASKNEYELQGVRYGLMVRKPKAKVIHIEQHYSHAA